MRTWRVLMIAASPFPLPQGSQVLIAGLAESLQQRGHHLRIVAYPQGAAEPRTQVPVHRVAGVPFYRQLDPGPAIGKPLQDLALARGVLEQVQRERPHLLHAHNIEGLLVGLWVRRHTGLPLVYHVHNLMQPELPTYFRLPPLRAAGRMLGYWVDRDLPRRAQACIVLNAQTAPHLQRLGVDPERIHHIPPGVSLEQVPPLERERIRRQLPPGPLVLYSGNLDRYQDLPTLIPAFQQVRQRLPQARLILATHREIDRGRARTLHHALGDGVQLLSIARWSDMQALIAACDVAVSPRQVCWGFPIKLLNYMAAGRPIVAAAGSAQGLRHMETGWIVSNGEVEAFAQAILTLLRDRSLSRRMGQAARKEVKERHNWSDCAKATEAVYAELLA
ncbi:MAG: glycosyltransferase family 4 protein [Chloroflexia bacterium]|nr:glycosyltransferase family 4 protein [Chloroflexia bacterium]